MKNKLTVKEKSVWLEIKFQLLKKNDLEIQLLLGRTSFYHSDREKDMRSVHEGRFLRSFYNMEKYTFEE